MKASKIVNKLLETDPDDPGANIERFAQAHYAKPDLHPEVRKDLLWVRKNLVWTVRALSALSDTSHLDVRDDAVGKLGSCLEMLDRYQEMDVHDWVNQALKEAWTKLYDLLEEDDFARREDAAIVAEVIKLLDQVL